MQNFVKNQPFMGIGLWNQTNVIIIYNRLVGVYLKIRVKPLASHFILIHLKQNKLLYLYFCIYIFAWKLSMIMNIFNELHGSCVLFTFYQHQNVCSRIPCINVLYRGIYISSIDYTNLHNREHWIGSRQNKSPEVSFVLPWRVHRRCLLCSGRAFLSK